MEVSNKIVMKSLGEVRPYMRNPRKNDKTVAALVELIKKVGFNVPIVIDKKGVIIKGRARYKAAIKLGMEEIPCIVSNADEEAQKLDRISDNRVSEFSEWLDEGLEHELDMLTEDFSVLEFDSYTIDDLREEITEEEFQKQMAKNAKELKGVTAKQLAAAEEKVMEAGTKTNYYKVVCTECGNMVFIPEGDLKPIEVDDE